MRIGPNRRSPGGMDVHAENTQTYAGVRRDAKRCDDAETRRTLRKDLGRPIHNPPAVLHRFGPSLLCVQHPGPDCASSTPVEEFMVNATGAQPRAHHGVLPLDSSLTGGRAEDALLQKPRPVVELRTLP